MADVISTTTAPPARTTDFAITGYRHRLSTGAELVGGTQVTFAGVPDGTAVTGQAWARYVNDAGATAESAASGTSAVYTTPGTAGTTPTPAPTTANRGAGFTGSITDDFATFQTARWAGSIGTYTIEEAHLRLDAVGSPTVIQTDDIAPLSLVGSCVYADVFTPNIAATGVTAQLGVSSVAVNSTDALVMWDGATSTIAGHLRTNYFDATPGPTVAYGPSVTVGLALCEGPGLSVLGITGTAGRLYGAVQAGGTGGWQVIRETATPSWVNSCRINLGVSAPAGTTAIAYFDDLNI